MHTNLNKILKVFSIYICIYIQQEQFFVNMYSFSVEYLRYLVNMSLSFGCHIIFFVDTTFFCDSHNFGAQRNFHVKYFFIDTT